jgi:hypothetical protein
MSNVRKRPQCNLHLDTFQTQWTSSDARWLRPSREFPECPQPCSPSARIPIAFVLRVPVVNTNHAGVTRWTQGRGLRENVGILRWPSHRTPSDHDRSSWHEPSEIIVQCATQVSSPGLHPHIEPYKNERRLRKRCWNNSPFFNHSWPHTLPPRSRWGRRKS